MLHLMAYRLHQLEERNSTAIVVAIPRDLLNAPAHKPTDERCPTKKMKTETHLKCHEKLNVAPIFQFEFRWQLIFELALKRINRLNAISMRRECKR